MKKLILLAALLLPLSLMAQEYTWETVPMDGSRTAAVKSGKIKVKANSSAAKVMKLVDAAQPAMARVKEVIGYSTEALSKKYPESALSNWTVDTNWEICVSFTFLSILSSMSVNNIKYFFSESAVDWLYTFSYLMSNTAELISCIF